MAPLLQMLFGVPGSSKVWVFILDMSRDLTYLLENQSCKTGNEFQDPRWMARDEDQ
jgi:hypothetical protein